MLGGGSGQQGRPESVIPCTFTELVVFHGESSGRYESFHQGRRNGGAKWSRKAVLTKVCSLGETEALGDGQGGWSVFWESQATLKA